MPDQYVLVGEAEARAEAPSSWQLRPPSAPKSITSSMTSSSITLWTPISVSTWRSSRGSVPRLSRGVATRSFRLTRTNATFPDVVGTRAHSSSQTLPHGTFSKAAVRCQPRVVFVSVLVLRAATDAVTSPGGGACSRSSRPGGWQ